MGRVTGYVEYASTGSAQAGSVQYERYGIVHDLRGAVIAERGRTLLARSSGTGFDTLYTHTVNNYSATGTGAASPAIESANAVGQSTGSILYYSETKNWLNGSASPVYGAGGYNYSAADRAYADSYTSYAYAFYEAEVQASVTLLNRDGSATSAFAYDGLGRLANVSVGGPRAHTLNYVNDINGQVLSRTVSGGPGSVKPTQHYHYYNGIMLGSNGNNGNDRPDMANALAERSAASPTTPGLFRNGASGPTPYADFDQAYDAVSPETLGQSPSTYTVRSGDSLESIAAQIWGDASLWYMIAEANPSVRSTGSGLAAGTSLIIPNKVANFHNTSDTFRPYDAERAVGDTQPGTPKPKVQKGACGTFGQILQAIVTIAVTVALSFTPLAPVAPLIGNAVGQGFGIATGIQQGGFNWKSLGMTALTMAIGNPIGGIGGAMLANAAVQGIGVATGLQDRFSWAGVAAAGVGAAIGSINFGSGPVGQIVATAADVLAQAATRSIIEGSDFGDNIIAQLPSAIGNLAGRAIGKGIATAYDGKSGTPPVTGDSSSVVPKAGSTAPGNAANNAAQKAAEQSATTNDEIVVTATRRQSYMYEGTNFLQYRQQTTRELLESPFTPLSSKIRLNYLRDTIHDTNRQVKQAEKNKLPNPDMQAATEPDEIVVNGDRSKIRPGSDEYASVGIISGGNETSFNYTQFIVDVSNNGATTANIAKFLQGTSGKVQFTSTLSGSDYGQGILDSGSLYQIERSVLPFLRSAAAGDIDKAFYQDALQKVEGYVNNINDRTDAIMLQSAKDFGKLYAITAATMAGGYGVTYLVGASSLTSAGAYGATFLGEGLVGSTSGSAFRHTLGEEVTLETATWDFALGGSLGIGGRHLSRSFFGPTTSVDNYVAGLHRTDTPSSTLYGQFEIEQTGPYNYRAFGGGTSIDIDGYRGTTMQDAKFIGNAEQSPYVSQSDVPSFLREKIFLEQNYEIQRYGAIIADPTNPFKRLEILTNEQKAVPYFSEMLKANNIPGKVKVVPTKIGKDK